jgi:death on curing protein
MLFLTSDDVLHIAHRTIGTVALTHSLVCNHALVDGNKRLGLACLVVFLGMNGRRLTMGNDEAYDFIYGIAAGDLRDVSDIARRIARGST